jgi:hypothetical protein
VALLGVPATRPPVFGLVLSTLDFAFSIPKLYQNHTKKTFLSKLGKTPRK